MATNQRQISKKCPRCGGPLSVKLRDEDTLLIRDGDAVGFCTNTDCMRCGDEIEVDPSEARR